MVLTSSASFFCLSRPLTALIEETTSIGEVRVYVLLASLPGLPMS